MRIVVCDDNNNFANSLTNDIKDIVSKNEEFSNEHFEYNIIYPAKKLLNLAKNLHIDILFLDINMPGIDGLEIAEKFYDYHKDTKIVFITNYENFVFYAFRFNPFRYIRKNHLETELNEALTSAIYSILNSSNYLLINTKNEQYKIILTRILYIEKEKEANYVYICTLDSIYRYRCNITDIINDMKFREFIKINSGTIVNLKHIYAIKEEQIVLSDNTKLVISKKCLKPVKDRFTKYLREKDFLTCQ